MYCDTEIIPKPSLMPQNSSCSNQENILNGDPIRRCANAKTSNRVFLGGKTLNTFHFQNFSIATITVYHNGYAVASTPSEIYDDEGNYLNSRETLAFIHKGHGIQFN